MSFEIVVSAEMAYLRVEAKGTYSALGELTARNRGANLLVTDSVPEAIDWLTIK